MTIDYTNTLLYIEPQQGKSGEPIIDDFTLKMNAAFAQQKSTGTLSSNGEYHSGGSFMGVQTCVCGAQSEPFDYELECGYITNSLCVHYLAWHRSEVPENELIKVSNLPNSQVTLDESTLK
jgi:hypothetical protein